MAPNAYNTNDVVKDRGITSGLLVATNNTPNATYWELQILGLTKVFGRPTLHTADDSGDPSGSGLWGDARTSISAATLRLHATLATGSVTPAVPKAGNATNFAGAVGLNRYRR